VIDQRRRRILSRQQAEEEFGDALQQALTEAGVTFGERQVLELEEDDQGELTARLRSVGEPLPEVTEIPPPPEAFEPFEAPEIGRPPLAPREPVPLTPGAAQVQAEVEAEVIGLQEQQQRFLEQARDVTERLFPQLIRKREFRGPRIRGLEVVEPGREVVGPEAVEELENLIEEDPEAFLEDIRTRGPSPDTEFVLREFFRASPQAIEEFFAPPSIPEIPEEGLPITLTGAEGEAIEATVQQNFSVWVDDAHVGSINPETGVLSPLTQMEQAKVALADAWEGYYEAPRKDYDRQDTLKKIGHVLLQTALVGGTYIEKYVGRPFKVATLEANTFFYAKQDFFPGADLARDTQRTLNEARAKFGWAMVVSEEVDQAWETYLERSSGLTRFSLQASEWFNPVYFVPIGGTFGLAAKFTSKIPVIGRITRLTAAGVLATESAVALPITLPLRGGVRAMETVGRRLGEKAANDFIKKAAHLTTLEDIALQSTDDVIKDLLQPNWQRSLIQKMTTVPVAGTVFKKGFEKGLGWRILVRREGQAIEDIMGKGAVVHSYFERMGVDAANVKLLRLRGLVSDPVGLYGFNREAISERMFDRLLPEFRGTAEEKFAGTLEHVFTKPEMYNFNGLGKWLPEQKVWSGQAYVSEVHEVNTEVLKFLRAEGVAPEHLTEDWWLHRVVLGKLDENAELLAVRGRPGQRGAAIGARRSYELRRKHVTMAEGITERVRYSANPEDAVRTYIQEAFKKVADARSLSYIDKNLTGFGITPAERLAGKFPQVVARATLTKQEAEDVNKLVAIINRAIRGEAIPEQTLRAMERRFPEMGARLRQTVTGKESPAAFGSVEDDIFGYPMPERFEGITAEAIRPTVEGIKGLEAVPVAPRIIVEKVQPNLEGINRIVEGLEGVSGVTAEVRSVLQDGVKAITEAVKPGITVAEREALGGRLTDTWGKLLGLTEKARAAGNAELVRVLEDAASFVGKTGTAVEPLLAELKSVTFPVKGKQAQLTDLRAEVNELKIGRRQAAALAREQRKVRLEQMRQPEIGEGYIMQPFAGGKIYNQEFIDNFNRFFGYDPGSKILRTTADVAGILRITKAAGDFSFMAIQGLPSFGLSHAYMIQNPKIGVKMMGSWYNALFQSVASFFSPDVFARWMAKNEEAVLGRVANGGSVRAVDLFTTLEARTGLANIAQKGMRAIPLKPYHRFELAFLASGEYIRDTFWKILGPKYAARGESRELARYLDRITGITDSQALGIPTTVRQFEQSFMWFAPNYTRASLTVVADVFRGGMTGAESRKALGGLIAAGAIYFMGTQLAISAAKGEPEEEAWERIRTGFGIQIDPITNETTWSPDARFMSIQIGDRFFGIGGFWYGLVRLAGNMKNTWDEEGDRERIDFIKIIKNGSLNRRDNPFIYWWFSRASPLVGAGFEFATGREYMGHGISPEGLPIFEDPASYALWTVKRFEPIWAEQGLNWMVPGLARDNEIPETTLQKVLVPVTELFGVRQWPEGSWSDFYERASELIAAMDPTTLDEKQRAAWEAGKLGWGELTPLQQTGLRSQYADLQADYEKAQEDSAARASGPYQDYYDRVRNEKENYYGLGFTGNLERPGVVDELLAGDLDTREMREKWGDKGMVYGGILDSIRREPRYAPAMEHQAKIEDERGEIYGFQDEVALAKYITIIYSEHLKPNGDPDWDRIDRDVDELIEEIGEDTYQRILKMYSQKKLLDGLHPILIRLSDDKQVLSRDYWRLPYKEFQDMTEEDILKGNVLAENVSMVRGFLAAETDEEREALIEAQPLLARDWRGDWRRANPEDDARLTLWGYGGKIQSMEAYNLVTQWSQELGIPLEQIGMGLPPRSLIPHQFEQNKIVAETSPSSWETKLYNLENPEWLGWQIEQGIKTDDLSDESIDALRLKVQHRPDIETYESYGNRKSDAYIESDEERRTTREAYLEAHPEFRDNRRRVDMYELGATDLTLIEVDVQYGQVTDEHGAGSAEAMLFRVDNPPLNTFGQDEDTFGWAPIDESRIPIWRIDVKYPVEDDTYDVEIPERFASIADKSERDAAVRDARATFLEEDEPYRKDRRRRQGYEIDVPTGLIEKHVAINELTAKGFRQERYLRDNQDYYEQVWLNKDVLDNAAVDFSKIPDERYDDLRDKWAEQFDQYETELPEQVKHIADDTERAEALQALRDKLFAASPGFFDDRLRADAFARLVPGGLTSAYVDYYGVLYRGKPEGWEKWWADDRVLMENPGFFNFAKATWDWSDRDFSLVGTVDFERKYNEEYINLRLPDGKADADARKLYRFKDREFDIEGARIGVWKTLIEVERGKRVRGIRGFVERFK